MVFRKKKWAWLGCLAGDVCGQVLGNGGWLPWVYQEVDLVQGVFAGRGLAAVQLVKVVDGVVEVVAWMLGGAGCRLGQQVAALLSQLLDRWRRYWWVWLGRGRRRRRRRRRRWPPGGGRDVLLVLVQDADGPVLPNSVGHLQTKQNCITLCPKNILNF